MIFIERGCILKCSGFRDLQDILASHNMTNTCPTMSGFAFQMCGGANLLPKLMPISFFGRVSRLWGVSRHLALQWGKSQCILECYPVLSCPQIMQIHISFRSRADLVLDPDHALGFLSYLALQACNSLCSVSDTSVASLFYFLPCSHKSALAQMSQNVVMGCHTSFLHNDHVYCPARSRANKAMTG